ncbi:MAG: YciI family protein [Vibrio sp.]
MFVVSLTYLVSLDEIDRFIPEHVRYLDEQYSKGNFILSGRKEPRTGGMIIATMDKRSELDEVLSQDPFHQNDLACYEVTEVIPSKTSKQLEFLL